jgi:hypothetical protein
MRFKIYIFGCVLLIQAAARPCFAADIGSMSDPGKLEAFAEQRHKKKKRTAKTRTMAGGPSSVLYLTKAEKRELRKRLNLQAESEGLVRLTEKNYGLFVGKTLFKIQTGDCLQIDERLDPKKPYLRMSVLWAQDFANDFGCAYRKQFGGNIQANGAARTVEHQKSVLKQLGSGIAAPYVGELASSHLYGSTLDIAMKRADAKGVPIFLPPDRIAWMRQYLLALKNAGLIAVIEEEHGVFHIFVYKKYSEARNRRATLPGGN